MCWALTVRQVDELERQVGELTEARRDLDALTHRQLHQIASPLSADAVPLDGRPDGQPAEGGCDSAECLANGSCILHQSGGTCEQEYGGALSPDNPSLQAGS